MKFYLFIKFLFAYENIIIQIKTTKFIYYTKLKEIAYEISKLT